MKTNSVQFGHYNRFPRDVTSLFPDQFLGNTGSSTTTGKPDAVPAQVPSLPPHNEDINKSNSDKTKPPREVETDFSI